MTKKLRLLSVLKWTLYALLFLSAVLLQTGAFRSIRNYGFSVSPVPVAIVCISMREGAEKGGLFALCAALFWCWSGAELGSVQIVTLTLSAVLCGALCRFYLTTHFLTALVLCTAALIFHEGICFLLELYFETAPLTGVRSLLLGIAASLPAVPVYFLLSWLIGKAGESRT